MAHEPLQTFLHFLRWCSRSRSLRLTPDGFGFVLLALALGIAALNTGNNLLYLLLAMMLSLIIVSGVLSEKCLRNLALSRRMPPHLFAGQRGIAVLRVANEKAGFPSCSLTLTDVGDGVSGNSALHLLHLPPQAAIMQSYALLFPRRGRYRLEGVKVATRFPFGLFIKTAILPLASEVLVYPTPQPLPDTLLDKLKAIGYDRESARRGAGSGLYNLRDYQAGDDSRSVHWKTSARHARLIIRETEAEDQRMVTIAMPNVRPKQAAPADVATKFASDGADVPEAFERAVVLVASLAAHFHQEGFAIRLLVGDEELPYGTGETHLYRIFRMLALCAASTEGAVAPSFLKLSTHVAMGQVVLLVLPWPDPALTAVSGSVTQALESWRFP